jgi:zinc transporter ZupT
VAEEVEEHPWSAAFSAVGAGTFIFVATVEVIPIELSADAEDRGIKTLALMLGAVVMGGLALWI